MNAIEKPETFKLDPEAIGNFVRLQRQIFGWKQDILASEAGVSLSTVQRMERGLRVRPSQLRKVAVALRRPEEEFLRERIRPTPEEVETNLTNMFGWTEGRVPVSVAPFRTEIQLRAILTTDSLLVDSDLDASADEDVAELHEWFDLACFVQAERLGIIGPKPGRDLKVRKLWREILNCVERIQRERCAACLTGIYAAHPSDGSVPLDISLIVLRSRKRDPAAGTISTVWVEEAVDLQRMLNDYFMRDS